MNFKLCSSIGATTFSKTTLRAMTQHNIKHVLLSVVESGPFTLSIDVMSVVMLSFIILRILIFNVEVPNVIMPSHYAECHNTEALD